MLQHDTIGTTEEQPYEKLQRHGAQALTDSELLAIILRTGCKDYNCICAAQNILKLKNLGLSGLHQLSLKELQRVKGIGRVKSIQLKAIAEISNRLAGSKMPSGKFKVNGPASIAHYYMEKLRYLDREYFKVVFLNTKNIIIEESTISIGTVNYAVIRPREIFIEALSYGAVFVILMHNHPSGDPTPSKEDIEITKTIIKAGQIIGIKVLDHIIFGNGEYISLKQEKLVEF